MANNIQELKAEECYTWREDWEQKEVPRSMQWLKQAKMKQARRLKTNTINSKQKTMQKIRRMTTELKEQREKVEFTENELEISRGQLEMAKEWIQHCHNQEKWQDVQCRHQRSVVQSQGNSRSVYVHIIQLVLCVQNFQPSFYAMYAAFANDLSPDFFHSTCCRSSRGKDWRCHQNNNNIITQVAHKGLAGPVLSTSLQANFATWNEGLGMGIWLTNPTRHSNIMVPPKAVATWLQLNCQPGTRPFCRQSFTSCQG